jgi:hypothetical protein
MRAGLTSVRTLLFVFFRCSFYFHLTTRLLIRHECIESARKVANCTVLRIDSTIMRARMLNLHAEIYRINRKIVTVYYK